MTEGELIAIAPAEEMELAEAARRAKEFKKLTAIEILYRGLCES